jgi:hypothetical protein
MKLLLEEMRRDFGNWIRLGYQVFRDVFWMVWKIPPS